MRVVWGAEGRGATYGRLRARTYLDSFLDSFHCDRADEAEEPDLAAAVNRWLESTLAERLSHSLRAFDALVD